MLISTTWNLQLLSVLKKFGFSNIRTASTPTETNKALTKDEDGEDVDVYLYRFQVQPKVSHLNVVKRIFRYLKGRPNLGLWYSKDSPFILEAFSDSDYAGASLDRKSTTGALKGEGSTTPPEPQPTPSTSQPNIFKPQTKPLPTKTPSQNFHEPQTEAHIEQLLPFPTTYQRKRKTQVRRRTKKDTKLPQTSVPQDLEADEAVHKEEGDSVERAITTAASLDATHDIDNIIKTQTTAMPNVDIPQGMDTCGSPKHQDTMGVLLLRLGLRECLNSPLNHLSQKVLDLEKRKDAQAVEILRLKKRVKGLERQRKSSTS
ncbi:hypothetical protein Tco_0445524 [Tanacetum coccineum]